MSDDDFLTFADETPEAAPAAGPPPLKVAIIDDDQAVHDGTRFALADYRLNGQGLDLISAHSAAEGRALMVAHPDIAVVLLDVVMESDNAGLKLVDAIRRDLGNDLVRIILRTGQPGQAPERRVIVDYDINDYRAKTELTADRLFAALTAALRAHAQLARNVDLNRELREANVTLEQRVAERTRALTEVNERLGHQSAALRRVNEFKNVMLGMVAHELKNPIGVILGRSEIIGELLDMQPLSPERLRQQVERIVEPAKAMTRMIDQLLADAMNDAEDMALHPLPGDLRLLVADVVDSHRLAAAAKRQVLDLGDGAPVTMVFDPDRMREAVDNLVSNAVKYSPAGGRISVSVEAGAGGARISVADEGPGLSPEDHGRLFGRFQRLSAKPTAGEGSTGLGLSITKHIVALHGGALTARSAGPGQGTVFTIQVPMIATEGTGR